MVKVIIKKQHGTFPKLFLSFLRRFHLLLIFIGVVGLLGAAVILISKPLTDTSAQQYTSSIEAGSIDQPTLERIQSLHTSDSPSTPQLPSGRVNPFAE